MWHNWLPCACRRMHRGPDGAGPQPTLGPNERQLDGMFAAISPGAAGAASLMARYQRGMPSLFVAIQAMSDTVLL